MSKATDEEEAVLRNESPKPKPSTLVFCGLLDIHSLISALSVVLFLLGGVMIVLALEQTRKGPPPDGPSTFSTITICFFGFTYLFSGGTAFATLYERNMLCESSASLPLQELGLRDARRVKQMAIALLVCGALFLLHSIIEVAAANPNFGLRQWLLTIAIVGLQWYLGVIIRAYCIDEINECDHFRVDTSTSTLNPFYNDQRSHSRSYSHSQRSGGKSNSNSRSNNAKNLRESLLGSNDSSDQAATAAAVFSA